MFKQQRLLQIALGCVFWLPATVPAVLRAQTRDAAADNSGKNKAHTKTADQQSSAASDRDLTRKIRRSIVTDKTLSIYGHNVKIITQGGAVTLKGPVHSNVEKQTIGLHATDLAGSGKVTNQLTIKQ